MSYDQDNIFAKILRGDAPAHKVYEDEETFAFMDVMPAAPGHTLVIPRRAAVDLFDMSDDTLGAVFATVRRVAAAVRDAFDADGIRIFQLNGALAGQTVFHYHVHIVPAPGSLGASHGKGPADPDQLAEHAARIRQALGED